MKLNKNLIATAIIKSLDQSGVYTVRKNKTGWAEPREMPKNVSEDVTEAIFEAIKTELLAGNTVHIAGFGTFSLKERKAGVARNPKTGEQVLTSPTKKVKFVTAIGLKNIIKATLNS